MAGYAVLDFETTGLFPSHDRVIEVAVVHVDETGTITGQWDTLVNPQRDLGAQRIHHITSAEVMDAPTFAEIAPKLIELLSGRVLVAHNASFDTPSSAPTRSWNLVAGTPPMPDPA
jgi:DNA polymerase-3 subunit epsilon